MQGALVDEVAVAGFTVVAEAFAVVGGEDNERFLQEAAMVEKGEEVAEDLVDVG